MYIYMYIYMYMCVCVCLTFRLDLIQDLRFRQFMKLGTKGIRY